MPEMNGFDARPRDPGGRFDPPMVLMLTTFDVDDYVYAALSAGASGFLLKDAPAEELIRAVRVVADGEALLAPSVTRRLIADVTSRRMPRRAAQPAALAALTPRETRGARTDRPRHVQRRDRGATVRCRADRQNACRQGVLEAGSARPRSGRGDRVRDRSGVTRLPVPWPTSREPDERQDRGSSPREERDSSCGSEFSPVAVTVLA